MYYLFYGDEVVNLGIELMFFEIFCIVLFYVGINSIFFIGLCVLSIEVLYYWKECFEEY